MFNVDLPISAMNCFGNNKLGCPIFITEKPVKLDVLSNLLTNPQPMANTFLTKIVHVIVMLENPALFVPEFFDKIKNLLYSKSLMSISIVNSNSQYEDLVQDIVNTWPRLNYKSVIIARSIKEAIENDEVKYEMVFFVKSSAQLDDPEVLEDLVNQDLDVVAPMLITNRRNDLVFKPVFWDSGWNETGSEYQAFHDVAARSYFAKDSLAMFSRIKSIKNFRIGEEPLEKDMSQQRFRTSNHDSADKILDEIIGDQKKCCLWRIREFRHCVLVKKEVLDKIGMEDFIEEEISDSMIANGFSIHLLNSESYGQIVSLDSIADQGLKLHPELKGIFENLDLWMKRCFKILCTLTHSIFLS